MTPATGAPLATFVASGGWTVRDAVTATADVLIVFFIIYRALKLVRGTRAAQTMTGMALIIGLFFFAKRLDLITVTWLFEKLIDYFIIFFVVIFQQDIRRALMQVGQNLFMRRQYEETYVIEEVVQAAGELAKQRMGALVVIERDADLSDHLGEVGVELDAKVTKELLLTLFIPEPTNHMHDGAVIIRNLRIHQAGAVLPLSANTKLDKQLGTRHRAAIGVTEETDAVVVVVSEERGTIGFCFNGNIVGNLDGPGLRRALEGVFSPRRRHGKSPASKREPAHIPRLSAEPNSLAGRTTIEVARPRIEAPRSTEVEDSTLAWNPVRSRRDPHHEDPDDGDGARALRVAEPTSPASPQEDREGGKGRYDCR